ncbi:MAG: hypothetical protein Q4C70_00480 [Planctomycetia bacterium]|nr:hypothetical protein [Planctomycetia bacterium]
MYFIKKYSLYILTIVGAVGVLMAAWFEGNATARWGQSGNEHLNSFKMAIENALPEVVAEWQADVTLDQIGIENELVRRVAGADGAIARHYASNGEQRDVQINITCGYSRNVAAHTPDVCFTGSGSIQEGDVEVFDMTYEVNVPDPENPGQMVKEERAARFKTAIFSDADNRYQQRVLWGWKGVDTGWVAPRFPRLAWNSNEPVCKMYVSLLEGIRFEGDKVDTLTSAEEFLKVFLPEADKLLTGEYKLPEGMVPVSDSGMEAGNDASNAGSGAGNDTGTVTETTSETEGENAAGMDLGGIPELDTDTELDTDIEAEEAPELGVEPEESEKEEETGEPVDEFTL